MLVGFALFLGSGCRLGWRGGNRSRSFLRQSAIGRLEHFRQYQPVPVGCQDQNLDVTWDSSQSNSYFYHSLGTIVAKSDNFGISFDLQLSNIVVGVNPAKPATFELAVGFINLASATSTNLERGVGMNATHGAHNLCEFDYFPIPDTAQPFHRR